MTDCELLLQQIKADPDDLVLRGAYADELDAVGGEENQIRAELLRLGVDLYRTDPEFKLDWSMNVKVFEQSADWRIRRTCELVRSLWKFWLVNKMPVKGSNSSVWRRGMPEEWAGSVYDWSINGDWICQHTPVVLVELKPFYWHDLLHMSTRYDAPNAQIRFSGTWELKGKPRQSYGYGLYATSLATAPQGSLDEFRTECRARTEGVLRGWWSSVREWKGIPNE